VRRGKDSRPQAMSACNFFGRAVEKDGAAHSLVTVDPRRSTLEAAMLRNAQSANEYAMAHAFCGRDLPGCQGIARNPRIPPIGR
ncbi:MAG: hypothetical protein KDA41_07550, partial [Planctomycetales bacterium]|nr:hypothetical protein [Planctomycetales bacterium]